MASEASVEISTILENIEPRSGRTQMNAIKRRNSPKSRPKILSRYLQDSLGSCHDFCKHGRKHAVEVKQRIPIQKFLKARHAEQHVIQPCVSAERNLKFTLSPKPYEDSETKKHYNPEKSKKEVLSSTKNKTMSSNGDLSVLERLDVSVEEDLEIPNSKPKHSKQSSLLRQANSETQKRKELQEGSNSRRKIQSKEVGISVLGERKALVPPIVPLSPKHLLGKFSNTTDCNFSKTLKGDSHLKNQNKVENIEPEQAINENVLEKTLYVIESTLENTILKPTQDDAHTTAQLSQSSPSTTRLPPPSSQKSLRPNRSRVQAMLSPPYLSLGKKGLRQMKFETHSTKSEWPSLQPLSSSSLVYPSNSKENGVSSLGQTKAMEKKKKVVNLKMDIKKTMNAKSEGKNSSGRRGGMLVSPTKSMPAQKLKFRRGTILDLKPENNTTPKKLKFRRVKCIGQSQNGKEDNKRASISSNEVSFAESQVGTKCKPEKLVSRNLNVKGITSATTKRSLRRNEIAVGVGELVCARTNSEKVDLRHQNEEATITTRRSLRRRDIIHGDLNTKINTEKVVLRHQNIAGKKKVQSLFNNVIEETASKLVEARKSKVKALVGAFETVISLQDARPSAASDGA